MCTTPGRRAANREAREAFRTPRRHGLTARHRAKLDHLGSQEDARMPESQPSIGRIVRVTLDGGTWPAIVVRPPGKRNGIDVSVFTPDGPRFVPGIAQATSRHADGTWHWPPRNTAILGGSGPEAA